MNTNKEHKSTQILATFVCICAPICVHLRINISYSDRKFVLLFNDFLHFPYRIIRIFSNPEQMAPFVIEFIQAGIGGHAPGMFSVIEGNDVVVFSSDNHCRAADFGKP